MVVVKYIVMMEERVLLLLWSVSEDTHDDEDAEMRIHQQTKLRAAMETNIYIPEVYNIVRASA